MQSAHTLTARLLGDPMPGRLERGEQLRRFHGVVDVNPIEDRATRRGRIAELLKTGPLSIRDIADQIGGEPGMVRNDVERMAADGITRRTGSGTGIFSTVLWHLAVDADTAKATLDKGRSCAATTVLDVLLKNMKPGVGYRPMDLYKALNLRPQAAHTALVIGVSRGVLTKSGSGRGSSGTVLYQLARKAERAA